jgi:hypothetical protein
MMNFFRMSNRYLDKLEEVYHGMGQEWSFFESLFPTVASVYDLKWTKWTIIKGMMHNRPCHTDFTKRGIYHPVKIRDGLFFPCHCFDDYCSPRNPLINVTRIKEDCKECHAIRASSNFTLSDEEKLVAGITTNNLTVPLQVTDQQAK